MRKNHSLHQGAVAAIAAGAMLICHATARATDCNGNSIPDEFETPGPLNGYGLSFDGIDDVVGVPGFGAIAPTTEITVEFWQKATGAAAQYTVILGPDTLTNRLAAAVPWSDGKVYWDFGDVTGAAPGRLTYLPPEAITGSWQHFALVASQIDNYMRIYRNGVVEASKTGMSPRAAGGSALRIGGLPGGFFAGIIDEVRIWNIARGQSHIQGTMNTTLSGSEPGLLGYWRLDEGMGTTAADSAGSSDGMLVNGPAWVGLYVPCVSGDMNCDEAFDDLDLTPFVLALSNPGAYEDAYPDCDIHNGDLNNDTRVDGLDIPPFVAELIGP